MKFIVAAVALVCIAAGILTVQKIKQKKKATKQGDHFDTPQEPTESAE